tara:strand:- start:173 stop:355 length:183 start_codon:yes stop_codon:yes gene_type:complete
MKEKNKIMSKKKGKTNMKLELLNEINQVDKKLKRFKNNENETLKLISRRDTLRSKLKTKK